MWILPACTAYASDSGSGTLPVIFPGSGNYLGAPSVTITSVSGPIYYTTDGSNPANSNTATAYSGPFPVNRSQLLLAAAHSSSGWSSVASAMFNVGGPAPQQPVVAGPPTPASPLELTALYNKRGQTVVSVVYNGTLDQDTWYTVIISDQATWNEVGSGKMSADNAGVVIGPVEEDHNYQLSIKQQGRVKKYYGTFSVQKKALGQEQLTVDQTLFYVNDNGISNEIAVPASPAQAVTYSGYHSNGSLIFSGFSGLFQAIDSISTWENGAYVLESDNGRQVFTTTNNAPAYYLYQHTAYYGRTTSLETVNAWIDSFACSHVIDGSGNFYKNSYASTGQPDDWALEPESGGYFYKYSYASSVYRAVYETIDFTRAELRESTDSARPYNAYVCISSQDDNGSAEGGIVCPASSPGNWYLYYKCTDTARPTITDNLVCGSTLVGGVYTPNANLELVYSYDKGAFAIRVKNLATNRVYSSQIITDQGIGGSPALISATSYVPITRDFNHIPDYQAGGYFKNVHYSQSYLADANGDTIDFWASSRATHYALGYNDDYCTYTEGNSSEDISISYQG
jgi:hypothetical protein